MRIATSLILALIWVLLISCERTECCVNPKMTLEGKYAHAISDCDNTNNPEMNCIEWLEFVNKSEVNILYGGISVIQRFTYTQEMDYISLEGPLTSSFRPIFIIKNDRTLERMDNGDLWIKD